MLHADAQTAARAGTITTDHGAIQTPMFMPVGTAGTVKGVTQQQLKEVVNAEIILGNTYHLYLRPGMDVLQKAGGLHRFNGWNRPLLTDSGGYQVFSLAANRKITEEGVLFSSHIDGSKHLFTPERVMDIERTIGADIIMAFDECPPADSSYAYTEDSMHRTHRWLDRCVTRFNTTPDLYGYMQNLFPIVQGGVHRHLRGGQAPVHGPARGGQRRQERAEHEEREGEPAELVGDHAPDEARGQVPELLGGHDAARRHP